MTQVSHGNFGYCGFLKLSNTQDCIKIKFSGLFNAEFSRSVRNLVELTSVFCSYILQILFMSMILSSLKIVFKLFLP